MPTCTQSGLKNIGLSSRSGSPRNGVSELPGKDEPSLIFGHSTGQKYSTTKLADLKPNVKSLVIGTLYKHQEMKPSILREISEDVCLFFVVTLP